MKLITNIVVYLRDTYRIRLQHKEFRLYHRWIYCVYVTFVKFRSAPVKGSFERADDIDTT